MIFQNVKGARKRAQSPNRITVTDLETIATSISEVNTLTELANVVENIIENQVKVAYTGIYMFHPKENRLKLFYAKGFSPEELKEAEATAMDRHPGKVFRSQKLLHVHDTTKTSTISSSSTRSFIIKSRVYIPVITREKCIGCFGLASSQTDAFSDEHIHILRLVGNMAGVVYQNIHQKNELETFRTQLEKMVKKRTSALRKTNSLLEKEIAERKATAEKLKETQAHLIHSEKLAGLGQLAAGVAHEINNPIGFVSSNNAIMNEYFDSFKHIMHMYETGKKEHEIIQKKKEMNFEYKLNDLDELLTDNTEGISRVKDIVCNLKDFARVEQSKDFKEVNIEKNIRSTLLIANNEIKYDAEIETHFGDVGTVPGNSGELNQVLLNIIINAAQAVKRNQEETAGKIIVSTYQEEKFIVIKIQDNGPGIPENFRDKIFDPFFTTKKVGEGTGLGLNISYDIIVNRHKGVIEVDSTVNEGTAFIIKLRRKDS